MTPQTLKVVAWGAAGALVGWAYVTQGSGGALMAAWVFAVVGIVVAVSLRAGPQREGEDDAAFTARRRSMRRWAKGLVSFIVTSVLAVGAFIWIMILAINAWAENK